MPYEFYKVLHHIGLFMLFLGLGGALVHAGNGHDKKSNKLRLTVALSHGIGLALILVAGFGLLAKLGATTEMPNWVKLKIAIWLAMGGLLAISSRAKKLARPLWTLIVVLAACAAYLAVFKSI